MMREPDLKTTLAETQFSARSSMEQTPDWSSIEFFRKMCRLLEMKRRLFLEKDRKNSEKVLPQSQFTHLMMIRYSLPCNLAKIMEVTGMTSAGASLFVNKLVKQGFLERVDDPADRRNVRISATPKARALLQQIDERLNRYIDHYFENCTPEELRVIGCATKLLCDKIEEDDAANRKMESES